MAGTNASATVNRLRRNRVELSKLSQEIRSRDKVIKRQASAIGRNPNQIDVPLRAKTIAQAAHTIERRRGAARGLLTENRSLRREIRSTGENPRAHTNPKGLATYEEYVRSGRAKQQRENAIIVEELETLHRATLPQFAQLDAKGKVAYAGKLTPEQRAKILQSAKNRKMAGGNTEVKGSLDLLDNIWGTGKPKRKGH